jgi:hypothetical protein
VNPWWIGPVMRFPPLAPVAHKDDLPEDSQMFRDRGLRDADAIDHRVDGLLPLTAELFMD